MTNVGVYTFGTDIPLPSFGSDLASCFDLSYRNPDLRTIKGFDSDNHPIEIPVESDESFYFPRDNTRLLIPTSMIFDLPKGHDMRVHPRSGVSFKQGLTLINCEGVIDEDYTQELFIPMINLSNRPSRIGQGMRLAQAEICAARWYETASSMGTSGYGVYGTKAFPWCRIPRPTFTRLDNPPESKTNRTGGFGSTGV